MRQWDVIVVGGGCAGLAAASMLAENNYQVLVLEKKPHLGGRASSYVDRDSGEVVDNGQHLFLGCYHETQNYLARIGSLAQLKFWNGFEASMYGPLGEKSILKTGPYPAPFHLLSGLLSYDLLSFKDRLNVARVALAAKYFAAGAEGVSVDVWLKSLGQSAASMQKFWDPLILATLNADKKNAPASLLVSVLKLGFMKSAADSRVGLASVGLTELLGDPARTFIEGRQGSVLQRARVKSFLRYGDRIKGVLLEDGQEHLSKAVVSALPPDVLRQLAGTDVQLSQSLSPTTALKSSSIISLHLWVAEDLFETPFVGFWDTNYHWAFRRDLILNSSKHLTLVISSAEKYMAWTKKDFVSCAQKELSQVFKKQVEVKRAILVKEPYATWVPPVGASRARPSPNVMVEGLHIAGDWTDTGLPATIESAIKSGHMAAQSIINTGRVP